jgi:hypothetical protein
MGLHEHRPTVFSEFSPPALENVSKVCAETYLRSLLIDGSYSMAVCNLRVGVTDCGRDMSKVVQCFKDTGVDYIDIVAYSTDDSLWREASIKS